MADAQLLRRFQDSILNEILPVTTAAVKEGEGVFGAAIYRKGDLSLVCVGTNRWSRSPLLHGETETLARFFEIPEKDRPAAKDCVFLTTHEPCPLCLSAITWAGFDNFYYFFTHRESADDFGDPVDLQILESVFAPQEKPQAPVLYNRKNTFWTATAVEQLASGLKGEELATYEKVDDKIRCAYKELWALHQKIQVKLGC